MIASLTPEDFSTITVLTAEELDAAVDRAVTLTECSGPGLLTWARELYLIRDSHAALLAREQAFVDALKRIEDIYGDWLEAGDSSTAMDDLIAVNDIAVAVLGDRSDYSQMTAPAVDVRP